MTTDLRCPVCSRLLGHRLPDGSLEVRLSDRYLISLTSGVVTCTADGTQAHLNISGSLTILTPIPSASPLDNRPISPVPSRGERQGPQSATSANTPRAGLRAAQSARD